jgi:hypothetical protein
MVKKKRVVGGTYCFKRPKLGRVILYVASSMFLVLGVAFACYLVIQHGLSTYTAARSVFVVGHLIIGMGLYLAASLKRVELDADRQVCILTYSIGFSEWSRTYPLNEIQYLKLVPTTSRSDSPCRLEIVFKNRLRPRAPMILFFDAWQAHQTLYSLAEQVGLGANGNPSFLRSIGENTILDTSDAFIDEYKIPSQNNESSAHVFRTLDN